MDMAQPKMPPDFRKWLVILIGMVAFSGLAALLLTLL